MPGGSDKYGVVMRNGPVNPAVNAVNDAGTRSVADWAVQWPKKGYSRIFKA